MISIVIATYNSENNIVNLFCSLRAQTDSNYELIIVDGNSTDSTISIINKNIDIVHTFISEPDFGVYDALNKGISLVRTKYYLTLGSDDILYPSAVENFNYSSKTVNSDFITAPVMTTKGQLLTPKFRSKFRHGHLAYISQHAVGTLISVKSHNIAGKYSNRFPIAADRFFILNSIINHKMTVHLVDFVPGLYSCEGISSTAYIDAILDIFKVDYHLSKFPLFTTIKYIFLLIINLPRIYLYGKKN
jgi:glycosyltransferase